MPKFNLYAGLSGGFGGANYVATVDANTEDEATQMAYELAIEEYQSYEGCHGIQNWEECKQDAIDSGWLDDYNLDDTTSYEELINDLYREAIEGWIEYYAIFTQEDDNTEVDCNQ